MKPHECYFCARTSDAYFKTPGILFGTSKFGRALVYCCPECHARWGRG